jgi:lysophospholipase L1-like esterase
MEQMKRTVRACCFLLALFFTFSLQAQNPQRFENEIKEMVAGDTAVKRKKLILFTGSSSIRFWKDLTTDFPKHNVLNRGFGGSEMAELVYYTDQLIVSYHPTKVFIYEGDNDIFLGRSTEDILASAEKILARLRAQLPSRVKIIFISAKPSVSRWHLKGKYVAFNTRLKQWTLTQKNVLYADVWSPMLDAQGEVRRDLFIADNLHMNRKGYDIWKSVIGKFL